MIASFPRSDENYHLDDIACTVIQWYIELCNIEQKNHRSHGRIVMCYRLRRICRKTVLRTKSTEDFLRRFHLYPKLQQFAFIPPICQDSFLTMDAWEIFMLSLFERKNENHWWFFTNFFYSFIAPHLVHNMKLQKKIFRQIINEITAKRSLNST